MCLFQNGPSASKIVFVIPKASDLLFPEMHVMDSRKAIAVCKKQKKKQHQFFFLHKSKGDCTSIGHGTHHFHFFVLYSLFDIQDFSALEKTANRKSVYVDSKNNNNSNKYKAKNPMKEKNKTKKSKSLSSPDTIEITNLSGFSELLISSSKPFNA